MLAKRIAPQVRSTQALLFSASVTAVMGLAAAGGAFAQDAGAQKSGTPSAQSGADQVVIVTARRRTEPLQKTPAAVSVLTSDTLETAGVKSVSDAALLIPNFVFQDGNTPTQPNLSLRGIPNAQGAEPPVAFVVDGVQAPALGFVNQDLLDIADIQVLAGPQGGIYGRDAVGGAVIIDTQRPTDTFRDTLTVDGGNGGYFQINNTASGPLIPDLLWAKLTLEDHQFAGLIDNSYNGKPMDTINSSAGRLELLAKPTSSTTINFAYTHSHYNDGSDWFSNEPLGTIGAFKQYPIDIAVPNKTMGNIDTYSLKIDQTTPIGTLTSISQYAQDPGNLTGTATWGPSPAVVVLVSPDFTKSLNEDLHLSSLPDQPVQWTVGGFYQLNQLQDVTNVYLASSPSTNFYYDNEHQNSESWAVYGQGSVPLPDNLKFSLALRYDSELSSAKSIPLNAGPNHAISHTFSKFQPSATLSDQFAPNVMGYVTVGEGFRGGGFNSYATALADPTVQRTYPSETLVNYEAGVKSQFLDHHLTFNADVFHDTVTDDQFFSFTTVPTVIEAVVTIKSLTIDGGEASVTYLPMQGLTLNGTLGVANSTINSNDPLQNDQGKHGPDAPLYNAHVSALYRQPLAGDNDVLYRIDYAYQGKEYYDTANQLSYKPYGLLNARIALENSRYSIALWGKNILGTRAPQWVLVGSPTYEMENLPATYGIQLTAHF